MENPEGLPTTLPKGFNNLVIFFLEKFNPQQLKQFVEFISYINKTEDGRARSIYWSDYIDEVCPPARADEEHHQISADSINFLLKLVSRKLGTVAVFKLLFHYDGNCVVINRPALRMDIWGCKREGLKCDLIRPKVNAKQVKMNAMQLNKREKTRRN